VFSIETVKAKMDSMGISCQGSDIEVLLKYIEFSETHDMRFRNIYNLNYIHGFINRIIAEKRIHTFGLAFFNIHNFTLINNKVGPAEGTKILEQYINGLQQIVTDKAVEWEIGVAGAVGGDNGIVLFHKTDQSKIIQYFSGTDFEIIPETGINETITLTAHVGINLDLKDSKYSYEAIDTCSLAMTRSRRIEGTPIVFFDSSLKQKIDLQREVESWYKDALKNEEFEVYYQPKVDLHKYQMKGAEALVRWFHDGKMVYPDSFIPFLEKNMSIKYLDLYMLNHVCQAIKKWLDEGKNVVPISVNLSRATLTINNLVTIITSTIDKYNVPRSLIQIELTESASTTNNDALKTIVEELSHEGISTAMDDFGTGYSSLSLIKELPWDVLKIDKSLLKGAQTPESNDQRMFKSIIAMANDLGLECIVEGVETRDDITLLKESNCWLAQGYYFSRPITTTEFEKLM